jgi:sugar lactone lactonase YvrE
MTTKEDMMLRTERTASAPRNRSGFPVILSVIVILGFACIPLIGSTHPHGPLPDIISLPNGWQHEGVAAGPNDTIYSGSIVTGAVYQASVRTGKGRVLVPPHDGRAAIGLAWDSRTNLLYVAGGATGQVFIYDGSSGADVAALQVETSDDTLLNDVIITRRAVYFTDSYRPFIYKIALNPRGELPDSPTLESIELTGDFESVPGEFNANGIEATPSGNRLIVVNSYLATLYSVAPDTGEAIQIDLDGETVEYGDGMILLGDRLYVVQNSLNRLAVIKLGLLTPEGSVKRFIENESFDIPTTVAKIGHSLYVVNARFNTEPTPETEYSIVRVPLKRK